MVARDEIVLTPRLLPAACWME